MKRTLPGLLITCSLLLTACKKDGPTPAYVVVDQPVVVSANGTDTLTSRITDLWVYWNDNAVGVWQPGRRIPIIGAGSGKLSLIAGVRKNGQVDERIQYPFYATYERTMDIVPEANTTVRPDFRYFTGLQVWEETFEGAGILFDTDTSYSDIGLLPVSGGPTGRYGLAELGPGATVFQCVSSTPFSSGATNMFLELDYKCNMQFQVGLRYSTGVDLWAQAVYMTLQPSLEVNGEAVWNKVYIDLGTIWSAVSSSDKRLFIRTELGQLPDGYLMLDNVRVIVP